MTVTLPKLDSQPNIQGVIYKFHPSCCFTTSSFPDVKRSQDAAIVHYCVTLGNFFLLLKNSMLVSHPSSVSLSSHSTYIWLFLGNCFPDVRGAQKASCLTAESQLSPTVWNNWIADWSITLTRRYAKQANICQNLKSFWMDLKSLTKLLVLMLSILWLNKKIRSIISYGVCIRRKMYN